MTPVSPSSRQALLLPGRPALAMPVATLLSRLVFLRVARQVVAGLVPDVWCMLPSEAVSGLARQP